MTRRNDDLKKRLSRFREIKLTVTGRRSGRSISVPVWFVSDDETLYLLPARGSDTQWYKNVLKKPSIWIEVGDTKTELKAAPVTDTKQVSSVVERFRGKYGDSGIKLYATLDVAVVAPIH